MPEHKDFYKTIEEICAKDNRYKPDGYEFVLQALHFTQNKLKRQGHLSGKELLEGIRDFAIEQYGPMAKTVLNHWGITETDDFGNIVFHLVEKKVLSKTETDSLDDFKDVYDFGVAFGNVLDGSIINEVE
jgi:uncharacterized repeat protein (TIGR04138 family)